SEEAFCPWKTSIVTPAARLNHEGHERAVNHEGHEEHEGSTPVHKRDGKDALTNQGYLESWLERRHALRLELERLLEPHNHRGHHVLVNHFIADRKRDPPAV